MDKPFEKFDLTTHVPITYSDGHGADGVAAEVASIDQLNRFSPCLEGPGIAAMMDNPKGSYVLLQSAQQAVANALAGQEAKYAALFQQFDEVQTIAMADKQRAEKAEAERDVAKQALAYEQRQNAELEAALAQVAVPTQQRGDFIERICVAVAEIEDRNSPEDQPEMMLVTPQELRGIIESAFENQDETAALAQVAGGRAGAGAGGARRVQ